MEQSKSAYEKKYQAQLDELQAKFDQLSAKARQADADAKIQMNSWLDSIRAKQSVLEARLESFRNSRDAAWHDLKKGVDEAVNDVSDAFDNARSHF
jgi:hypothetical protein